MLAAGKAGDDVAQVDERGQPDSSRDRKSRTAGPNSGGRRQYGLPFRPPASSAATIRRQVQFTALPGFLRAQAGGPSGPRPVTAA